MVKGSFQILLVDDDAVDRELFTEAILASGSNCMIAEAGNGQEALDHLSAREQLPNLIILDLNMPVKDGRETLKELKSHETFRNIPVCILSTSSAQFDVVSAYESGATLFLVKPLDYKELVEMLSNLVVLFSKYAAFVTPRVS